MLIFKNWFFGQLPYYFKGNDSYVDVNGKGLLERYLSIYGSELDEGIVPYIENFVNCVDVKNCDNKFLRDIAYTLGNPPDPFLDIDQYRLLLGHIIDIYKIKGTKKSYILFFALLGIDVTLIEYEPVEILFDSDNLMDTPNSVIFDTSCPSCSDYSLFISSSNADCSNPTGDNLLDQTTIDIIKATIPFLEPINAKLREIVNKVVICETINICMPQVITFTTLRYNVMDDDDIMDDGLNFDLTPVDTYTVTVDCSGAGNPTGIGYMGIEIDNQVS